MKISKANAHYLFLLAAALLMHTGRARADHPPGTIFETWGYVLDTASNAVVGVEVVGDNFIGDFFPSITDSNGMYSVIFPSENNYRIEVNCVQLTALGYACAPAILVPQEADPIRHDFIVEPATSAMLITNSSLPKGNVGAAYNAQLGVAGGNPPYSWQLTFDSPPLPPGLSLNAGGLISGTPTTNSLFAFKAQVMDANSAVTNKVLFITINRQPVLLTPAWQTNRFLMRLFGAADQNYTIQMSTDLKSTNWTSLFVTNHPSLSSYFVIDSQATNHERFYRVIIGP